MSTRTFSSALSGVVLLLKFDLRAWGAFDKTLGGFWRSFTVAGVLAPLYFAHVILQFGARERHLDFVPYLVVQGLAYIVSWTLFPFAMMYIAQLLQRGPRYFWHMVPYNWLQLPLGLAQYFVWLAADMHLIPGAAGAYTELGSLLALMIYGTFLAGVGLQVSTGTALSLVVLDVVLSLIAGQLIVRI